MKPAESMFLGMTRPNRAILIASVALLFGLTVRANEKPTEEYRKAMKDLEAASEIMRHHSRMVEPGGDFAGGMIGNFAASFSSRSIPRPWRRGIWRCSRI